MVVPMVLIMSLYGACEGAVHTGAWGSIPRQWLINIPRNFIMALPFQLLIAGPWCGRCSAPPSRRRRSCLRLSKVFLLSKGFQNPVGGRKITHAKTR